ncbi:MAG: hypothetical protein PHQ85_09470 [Eubacteriales bacterium]|jgi:hypothetical protein|nr:hypothetical protein [Eubacteriales bacterium]MDD4106118.1 hypothetical protein [Eubacteriales bacterium]MDD4711504.1 hypothetical protein [Eubacteriales bacterium]NLO15830.1 hypothetical protein [Clostridiales bacterium]
MKLNKNLGMILLSVWLIMTGVLAIFNLQFEGRDIIMSILAIASGALILFGNQ